MYSFGYGFRPWRGYENPARRRRLDPAAISSETAARIRGRPRKSGSATHVVVSASWSTPGTTRWTVRVIDEATGEIRRRTWTSTFLAECTGYYDYDNGYSSRISPGEETFSGQDRAPAALARGSGLPRQEGRGDRERRYRHHARSVDGRRLCRARDHAAALAHLYRLHSRRRSRSRVGADESGLPGRAHLSGGPRALGNILAVQQA